MENKKTFIRYISHEIRSPLATTSQGLDFLIDQIREGRMTGLGEILEVLVESKVTCELATNTLNDLLMFDKMETGMMEVSKVECDAWEFIQNCVQPFTLQVLFCYFAQLNHQLFLAGKQLEHHITMQQQSCGRCCC